ncbi:MAG: DeoR/GlpR family DNA-binding transcription regulator [Treponema sp.]|jgi:DeoR/GlpR family transcriptional regulator of sugar metabolism|nr:DeoR/GlpR family DNA-binding transcription regulator [Treponema sp.]
MRINRSVVDARRAKILKILEETGFVKVNQLAGQMGVSPLTIRRDLDLLAEDRKIDRFYGGASLLKYEDGGGGNIFSSGFTLNKLAVAQYAAALVEDGDTIFINTSSTALGILPYITAKQVTVITNNVKAVTLDHRKDMILVFTGGELRFPKEAMVGDFALNNLNRVTASKCFLGCNGINPQEGVTTAVLQEATINNLMLTRVTGPRYILADKSKIGRRLNFIYGRLEEITLLITDTEAPGNLVEELRKTIDVVQVEPLKKLPYTP